MPLLKKQIKGRITVELTLWFLIIGLIPMAAANTAFYLTARKLLVAEETDDLVRTAGNHISRILTYIEARKSNAAAVAQSPGLARATADFSRAYRAAGPESETYKNLRDRWGGYLAYCRKSFAYEDLFLVSPQGDVVFAVKPGAEPGTNLLAGPFRDTKLAQAFGQALKSGRTSVSIYDYYPPDKAPAAFIAAPILRREQPVGAAVFQLEITPIYDLIGDYSQLGQTGETIIVVRRGDKVLFLAPTRSDPGAAFNRTEDLNRDRAVSKAASGLNGAGLTTDYRGRQVLAVWRFSPELGWGIVVKIDAVEVFAPVRRLGLAAAVMVAVMLGLIALASVLTARRISRPVIELTELTETMANGDLSRRIEIRSHNELGRLAGSFNHMTEQLIRSMDDLKATTAAKERIETELTLAADIQMSMVPRDFPAFPDRTDFAVFASMVPAKAVGGDLYDFFLTESGKLCLVIGDAAGKGVPAALFMAQAVTLLKMAARDEDDPALILARVNDALSQGNEAMMFVTVFLALFDPETGRLVWANGGHNPPVLIPAREGPRFLKIKPGLALGVMEEVEFTAEELILKPGDELFCYTDGVTEAINPAEEMFTESRLLQGLTGLTGRSPEDQVAGLGDLVNAHAAGADQFDDMTMLAFVFRGLRE